MGGAWGGGGGGPGPFLFLDQIVDYEQSLFFL